MVSTTVTPAPTADSSSASNREAPLLNIVSPELSSSSFSPPIAAAPLHASEIVHTPPLEEKTTVVAAQTDARAGTKSQIDGSIAILKSSFSKIWLKKYGGITIRSIVQFTIALIFAIGTSLGWVFGALGAAESTRKLRQSGLDAEQPIFIHVLFAVVVAISFALLKLCFSRIRAERYAHTHPGEPEFETSDDVVLRTTVDPFQFKEGPAASRERRIHNQFEAPPCDPCEVSQPSGSTRAPLTGRLPHCFSMLPRRRTQHSALLYILIYSYICTAIAKPYSVSNFLSDDDLSRTSPVEMDPPNNLNTGPNFLMSWLLGMLWGDESTVSVVDRTPVLPFAARPAAFGPSSDVLGYMIRVEDFSIPCRTDIPQRNQTSEGDLYEDDDDEDVDRGYPLDRRGTSNDWKKGPDLRKGCAPICFDESKRPKSAETWIGLVMRGGCTFVEKIREAQRLGAKGVVVGGETPAQDTHGDGLVQMYSLEDASDITIPSVYISHESYRTLSSLIASSNTSTWQFKTVSVVITIDLTGWQWYSPVLTFLLLLFLPSILTLLTLLIHRCRAARAARRERAPEEIVQNLPWSVWEGEGTVRELEKGLHGAKERQERPTNPNSESSAIPSPPVSSPPPPQHVTQTKKWYERQVECAICLEDFAKGDKVRVLPCRHVFHMEEVDDWLIHRKKLCPICKHDVTCPVDVERTITREPGSIPEPLSVIQQDNTEPTERTPLLN